MVITFIWILDLFPDTILCDILLVATLTGNVLEQISNQMKVDGYHVINLIHSIPEEIQEDRLVPANSKMGQAGMAVETFWPWQQRTQGTGKVAVP